MYNNWAGTETMFNMVPAVLAFMIYLQDGNVHAVCAYRLYNMLLIVYILTDNLSIDDKRVYALRREL